MSWLKSMLTEMDNQTWCPVRVIGVGFGIAASTTYLGLAIWTVVYLRQPLDYGACGAGLSSVWATVAAAIIGKARWGDRR